MTCFRHPGTEATHDVVLPDGTAIGHVCTACAAALNDDNSTTSRGVTTRPRANREDTP